MSLPQHNGETIEPTPRQPYKDMARPLSNAEGEEALTSSGDSSNKEAFHYPADVEAAARLEDDQEVEHGGFGGKVRGFMRSRTGVFLRDMFLICLLLGWWIPGIIREETRHYWIVTTIWTWFFILLILFHNSRYIPQRPFVRVISAVWGNFVEKPWNMVPLRGQQGFGWLAVLVLFLASAFGIKANEQSPYKWRAVSLCGMLIMYAGVWLCSAKRSHVKARPIILGLCMQVILGLFVFKTGAGRSLFYWMSMAAADFLQQGINGGAVFFWRDFTENGYFFTNTLSTIIFFVAFAVALYYSGVMTWVLKKFAWFFTKTFGLSGAEAVAAASCPFIGQGENCILTKPFVKHFTESEMHLALTSGFATIAGSVFLAYVGFGIPPRDLLTSSIMSIPASIALSKTMMPETEEPVTRGASAAEALNKGDQEDDSVNLLHSFSNGAWLGLKVAGLIFCNVLVIMSMLYAVNGLLAWIGQFWGIARTGSSSLSIELIGGYIFYPFTFLLGVPPADILPVSRLIATKVFANEFAAYSAYATMRDADPTFISARAQLITRFALCGFGNLGSLGIQIGILNALAPNKSRQIIRVAPRALCTGIIATLSTAAVAGLLGE